MTLDEVIIPNSVVWIDEFSYSPIQQTKSYTLSGALVLESGVKQAGRPITLEGRVDSGWVNRSIVDALYNKLADNAMMTLTLADNRAFNVRFDHEAKPVDARTVSNLAIPNPANTTEPYTLTIRLIEVTE
jgi:hypothetical protein